MNHVKWTSSVAVACLGVAALPAAADSGFYVTASAGTTTEDPESRGVNISNGAGIVHVTPDSTRTDDGDLAWGVGLGYRINRFMSAEIEYVDFGTTDISEHYDLGGVFPFPFPTELDLAFSSHVTGPLLSVLGTLPVARNFELFLRGGALFASREYSTQGDYVSIGESQKFADTVWVVGAGATWSFAKHWGIRAEYQQTGTLDETIMSGATELKRASVTALFRF
jgi:hypothetical protein